MLQQQKSHAATILLLLLVAIATVASVPTSVLVQNSELAANANGNNNRNFKVKRSSSNNLKESASSAAAALNKKSSPETVPASFNAPPAEPVSSSSSSSSSAAQSSSAAGSSNAGLLPTNGDIINSAIAAGLTAAAVEAAAAASQRELEQQQQQYADEYALREADETPTLLRKRGINSQEYLYGSGGAPGLGGGYGYNYGNTDFYNVPLAPSPSQTQSRTVGLGIAGMPNGVWSDEIDPSVVYTDLQEFDDYPPRAPYHNKAYDNLQNILNSETYLEPVPLPLQYGGRYYGADAGKKKSINSVKNIDPRLKRDTKLTPADMLALVALVEAGERARNAADVDNGAGAAANSYLTYPDPYDYNNNNNAGRNGYYTGGNNAYDYQPASINGNNINNNMEDVIGEYNGAWLEPAVVDYYGVPYNMEALPKYELQPLAPREHKYSGQNRYAAKRFMVSKKKRSLGQSSYSSYGAGNGEKYF